MNNQKLVILSENIRKDIPLISNIMGKESKAIDLRIDKYITTFINSETDELINPSEFDVFNPAHIIKQEYRLLLSNQAPAKEFECISFQSDHYSSTIKLKVCDVSSQLKIERKLFKEKIIDYIYEYKLFTYGLIIGVSELEEGFIESVKKAVKIFFETKESVLEIKAACSPRPIEYGDFGINLVAPIVGVNGGSMVFNLNQDETILIFNKGVSGRNGRNLLSEVVEVKPRENSSVIRFCNERHIYIKNADNSTSHYFSKISGKVYYNANESSLKCESCEKLQTNIFQEPPKVNQKTESAHAVKKERREGEPTKIETKSMIVQAPAIIEYQYEKIIREKIVSDNDVYVREPVGCNIIAPRVFIETLGTNNNIIASKSITIVNVKGDNNTLMIEHGFTRKEISVIDKIKEENKKYQAEIKALQIRKSSIDDYFLKNKTNIEATWARKALAKEKGCSVDLPTENQYKKVIEFKKEHSDIKLRIEKFESLKYDNDTRLIEYKKSIYKAEISLQNGLLSSVDNIISFMPYLRQREIFYDKGGSYHQYWLGEDDEPRAV